jgi:hypothetical protein
MDKSFSDRERFSPAAVVAGMRSGGPVASPAVVVNEELTHYQRAQRLAERYHKRGESISWDECLTATAPKLYSRGRTPTPDEVLAHATKVNSTGKRSLSYSEAEAELCGA